MRSVAIPPSSNQRSAMTTFAELGVPFPLFEAPTSEASEYVQRSTCGLCGGGGRHCFRLHIGCAVIVPCPSCGVENGLDALEARHVQ